MQHCAEQTHHLCNIQIIQCESHIRGRTSILCLKLSLHKQICDENGIEQVGTNHCADLNFLLSGLSMTYIPEDL